MKKFFIGLATLLLIAAIVGCGYLFYRNKVLQADRDTLLEENANLNKSIQAIGELTVTYTVKAKVKPGKMVTEDDLVEKKTSVSSFNDNFIVSKEDAVGKFFKVGLWPGADVTKDVLMEEEFTETVYERDLSFGFVPIGLNVGDYVDIRVSLPDSENFIALNHKRIYMMFGNVVKVKMTEAELAIWETVIYDRATFGTAGLKIMATKYIEPGINDKTIPFYPVRASSESVINMNPNIKDKTRCINTALRLDIDARLAYYTDPINSSKYGSPTSDEESKLNEAQQAFIDLYTDENGKVQTVDLSDKSKTYSNISGVADLEKGNVTGESSAVPGESESSKEVGDMDLNTNENISDLEDDLNTIETMAPADANGNQSNVSDDQKNNAGASDLFGEEEDIH